MFFLFRPRLNPTPQDPGSENAGESVYQFP